jgi:hypothetical protein
VNVTGSGALALDVAVYGVACRTSQSFAGDPSVLSDATSEIRVINNTLYSPGDPNYGIWFGSEMETFPVLAADWFSDAAAGDFGPAPGSPLHGGAAACEAFMPSEDVRGIMRMSADIGAIAAE